MNTLPVSVSTVAYDGYPLSAALDSIRNLGFQVVEIAYIRGYSEGFDEDVFDETNAAVVRDLLSERGLTCRTLSAHMDTSTPGSLEALRRRVAFAAAIGASYLATNTGPAENRKQFLTNLAAIAPEAAALGITICVENPGDGIDAIINDGASGFEVVNTIDDLAVRMNYDFGNLMSHRRANLNPAVDCRYAQPVTVHYHLKDVVFDGQQWDHVAIGAGAIDYDTIFRHFRDDGLGVALSIEVPTRLHRHPTGRPFTSPTPLPIAAIETIIDQSHAYIVAQLAR